MSRPARDPNQEMLPFEAEIVPIRQHVEIDWERKLTLRRLVWIIAENEPLPQSYATSDDLTNAQPLAIEAGLYIPKDDPRYENAEGLIEVNPRFATDAAKTAAQEVGEGKQPKVPPTFIGVIFPPDEFKGIGYYPKALAKRVRTDTRAANLSAADRDEVDEKAGRSAGHTLEGYIKKMNGLQNGLFDERNMLRSLFKDLTTPAWQAHYKARNLDKKRKQADEKIHKTAEVASINLNLGNTAIEGLHKAIKFNLYGHLTQDQLVESWLRYIVMTGRYASARIDRLVSSIAASQSELGRYQEFLDRKPQ